MSITDDIFDLQDILESIEGKDDVGIVLFDRLVAHINKLEYTAGELKTQNDILSQAIVVKGDYKITRPVGGDYYINLELRGNHNESKTKNTER